MFLRCFLHMFFTHVFYACFLHMFFTLWFFTVPTGPDRPWPALTGPGRPWQALTGPGWPFHALSAPADLPGPYKSLPALSDPSLSSPTLSRPYDAHRRRAFKVVTVCYRLLSFPYVSFCVSIGFIVFMVSIASL